MNMTTLTLLSLPVGAFVLQNPTYGEDPLRFVWGFLVAIALGGIASILGLGWGGK